MRACSHATIARCTLLLAAATVLACNHGAREPKPTLPPEYILGAFVDDYGIEYQITPEEWVQLPGSRYRIVAWHTEEQFAIAQNDSANPTDGGRWTRIDWLQLAEMPPFGWAFCYGIYDAPTPAAAESVHTASRETPRSGCNGYPFSRMRSEPTVSDVSSSNE